MTSKIHRTQGQRSRSRRQTEPARTFRPSSGCSTPLPIVQDWHRVHGFRTKNGAFCARTDTDHVTWDCPTCGTNHRGPNGISLFGVSDDLYEVDSAPVLALRFRCYECGLIDFFKIALDRDEPVVDAKTAEYRGPQGGSGDQR